jgi:hypothetical protein
VLVCAEAVTIIRVRAYPRPAPDRETRTSHPPANLDPTPCNPIHKSRSSYPLSSCLPPLHPPLSSSYQPRPLGPCTRRRFHSREIALQQLLQPGDHVLARLDGTAWWEGCVLRVVSGGCTVLGDRARAREREGEVEGKEEVDRRRTLKSGLKPAASMAATR